MPSDADKSSDHSGSRQAVPPQGNDHYSGRRSPFHRDDIYNLGRSNRLTPLAAGAASSPSGLDPSSTEETAQATAHHFSPRQLYQRVPGTGPSREQASTSADTLSPPPPELSLSPKLRNQLNRFIGDQVTPVRLASHLAVLIVVALVLVLSQMDLSSWQVSLRGMPGLSGQGEEPQVALPGSAGLAQQAHNSGEEALQRAVVPFSSVQQAASQAATEISEISTVVEEITAPQAPEIRTYVVRPGDTVLGIAAKFGLRPETIQWANPTLESNPDLLRVGDRLVILPVDGALHVVQPGDTLSSIATKYKVETQAIADYPLNGLESINTSLSVGMQLVIPHGIKPYIPRRVVAYSGPAPQGATKGSGVFVWPTSGTITQPFWGGHRALDIGAWTGTPVKAADSGYVIAANAGGWNSGYGTMVMIDHGNGFVTLYGHMNSIYVRQGESVSKGQQIGTVGNTGRSTGPHLHFEIRYQGVPRNPFNYLP